MLKKIITAGSSLLGLLLLTSGDLSDNGKAGKTGSPYELTCHDCHDAFAEGSGGGSITLGCTNMMGWQYLPGTNYHMTCTVAKTGINLFGLGLECLSSTNENAGDLVITSSATTQIKNATISGVSRKNVVHQLNGGSSANSKTFAFDWVAPATNIGDVTFYFAGVASDGDGDETVGDYVYTGSQVVSPALTTGLQETTPMDGGMLANCLGDRLTLSYAISAEADVRADLYDLGGQLVRPIVAAHREPGRHVEMVDGMGSHAVGLYVVRTNINGVEGASKVMLTGAGR